MADFALSPDYSFLQTIGVDAANSTGTAVTSALGSKGAFTEISAATSADADLIIFMFSYLQGGSLIRNFLLDIAIGLGGSEELIVSDFFYRVKDAFAPVLAIYLPLNIPSGSRISVATQTNSNVQTCTVWAGLFKGSFFSPPPYSELVTFGLSGVNADVTAVDPGAVANTKGAWVEITASTPFETKEGYILVGDNTNAAHSSGDFLLDLAIGAAASEEILIEDIGILSSSFEAYKPVIPIKLSIPAGARISARLQSTITDATDRVLSIGYAGFR